MSVEKPRENLRQRIINSLVVYHDRVREARLGYQVGYLRFIPIETKTFRHGISIYIEVKKGEEAYIKGVVADYLLEAFESIIT